MANVDRGGGSRDARNYVRTLCEWLGARRKYADRLDPHGRVESDSGKARSTERLESTPFQQHGGRT